MSFKTLQNQVILLGLWLFPQLFIAQKVLEPRSISSDKTFHLPANTMIEPKASAFTTGLTLIKRILDRKKVKDLRYMTASIPYKIPLKFSPQSTMKLSTVVHYALPTMKRDKCLPVLYFSLNMTCQLRKK